MTLQERLDLKRRFPGYFHPWIFRGAFILVAVIFASLFAVYGFDLLRPSFSLHCPEDSGADCANPFYLCENKPVLAAMNGAVCDGVADTCRAQPELCAVPALAPGEYVGVVPGYARVPWGTLILLIFAGAFLLNHVVARFKK